MKSGPDFNPAGYAPVAERITQFYEAHPQGRIVTELMGRTLGEVVFRASVYRDTSESDPAATGWAAEREGDGDVNEVACLENTETSAVGRALANLGFTASRLRPSREEMDKADRARDRLTRAKPRPVGGSSLQLQANAAQDALDLLARARRRGYSPARSAVLQTSFLRTPAIPQQKLERIERKLRDWLRRHSM